MKYQAIFKRFEIKFILSGQQMVFIKERMQPFMRGDSYGKTSIRNLYYDTDCYHLIRRSCEKPIYKEKLRVRSYGAVDCDGSVFVELKKKFDKIVYKRRVVLPERQAMDWLSGSMSAPDVSQITAEIDYFLHYYNGLAPRVYLSYDREAYLSEADPQLRVTFDENIQFRCNKLSLLEEPGGYSLLGDNEYLMEIKASGGIPMWLAHALSEAKIYKTSFSKYGVAYQRMIYPQLKGALFHV